MIKIEKQRKMVLGLIGALIVLIAMSGNVAALPFVNGDVFAATGSGTVKHYNSAGVFQETLNTLEGGFTTGMAFDSSGNLYVTNFGSRGVSVFDSNGNLLPDFGVDSDYSTGGTESILFDGAGNAYVGAADGDRDIRKFNAAGTLLSQFNVAIESRGSDWIDLAADQCTMYYTSEGFLVKKYDVCTNTQLPNFATLDHRPAFALRLLPGGGLLVADSQDIHRLDSSGVIIKTYDATDQNSWFALNLDPDGTSFWSGDFGTGKFFKFDIASGAELLSVNTLAGSSALFGLVVFGEQTAATGSISGKKYNDADGNGAVNGGETGLQGWTITLKDSQGNTIATTTTNINGDYSFGSLQAGTYVVSEVLQAGWSQTAPSSGTYTINLGVGQNVGNKDFLNTQGTTCTGGTCIPEFPTVALPIMSVLGIMFLMLRKKHN